MLSEEWWTGLGSHENLRRFESSRREGYHTADPHRREPGHSSLRRGDAVKDVMGEPRHHPQLHHFHHPLLFAQLDVTTWVINKVDDASGTFSGIPVDPSGEKLAFEKTFKQNAYNSDDCDGSWSTLQEGAQHVLH